jgi:hypothetical protein
MFSAHILTIPSQPDSKDINSESIEVALDTIGIHVKFSEHLRSITFDILSRVLLPSFPDSDSNSQPTPTSSRSIPEFPPYIAVHIRRGDFDSPCRIKGIEPTICFPPLSVYADTIEQVRQELSSNPDFPHPNARDLPVLIFSDEPKHTNPWYLNRFGRLPGTPERFWEDVRERGWMIVDHSAPDAVPAAGAPPLDTRSARREEISLDTESRYGVWYPTLVDSALMAYAVGFVGTEPSTFSLLAAKRVKAWQGGVVKMVKSGIQ